MTETIHTTLGKYLKKGDYISIDLPHKSRILKLLAKSKLIQPTKRQFFEVKDEVTASNAPKEISVDGMEQLEQYRKAIKLCDRLIILLFLCLIAILVSMDRGYI